MSNSLDPDQPDVLSCMIWVQTVCKCYQQTTLAGKELKARERCIFWFVFLLRSLEHLDQARCFVWPDLGPNCLQRLSADDTSRQRVKDKRNVCFLFRFSEHLP